MTRIRSLVLVAFLAAVCFSPAQAATGKKKTDKAHPAKAHLVVRSYSVADLLPSGEGGEADMLIKFVKAAIEPTTWSDHGGRGTVEFYPANKCLVIHQTSTAHKQVDRLLKALVKLQGDAARHEEAQGNSLIGNAIGAAAGAMMGSQPVVPASYSACPAVPCSVPARSPVKQYGHFVIDNVRVNAMGVSTTIKKIKFMYKGDGIEADVAKCALTNGDSERKGDVEKILTKLTELVDSMSGKKDEKKEAYAPPAPSCSAFTAVPAPCPVCETAPAPRPVCATSDEAPKPEPLAMPREVKECDKEVKPCKCEKQEKSEDDSYNDD